MKKIFILVLLLSLITIFSPKVILGASDSATIKSNEITDKAKDILDRVATKVAQLVENERQSYLGVIKSKSEKTEFFVTTSTGEIKIITNEATNFYKLKAGTQSTSSFASLKVDDNIVAIGLVDPSSKEMTARQIIVKVKRTTIAGIITQIKDNVVTIKTYDEKDEKIDLTDAVTLEKINSENKIVKASKADFQIAQPIFAIGYSFDPKTKTYSVLKSVTIPK